MKWRIVPAKISLTEKDVTMNEMMTQLLAQQMGTAENGGVDPEALLNLTQNGDPMMAMMTTYLQQQKQNQKVESQVMEDYQRKLTKAHKAIRALREYALSAEGTLLYFGELFGACASCWGQDENCPECHGRGSPGSNQIDKEDLLSWVVPALKSVNLRVVSANPTRK